MARITLWLQLLTLFVCLRLSTESCYSFLNQNIGHLKPFDFHYVEEGTTLHLECSLDSVFAANKSLTADDIYWENPTYQRLSEEVDHRVNLTTLNNLTASLDISDITVSDDGQYYCAVNVAGMNWRICSIEVPVAGPPKKYLDFSCESQNYMSLICIWRKSGYYLGRSQTKFTLKYRTEAGSRENDCPKLTSTRDGWYKCEWNATYAQLMKLPPILLQYTHYLTINGTNSFSSETWNETVTPALFVRPAPPVNLTASLPDRSSCQLSWVVAENLVTELGMRAQIDICKTSEEKETVWETVADNIDTPHYNLINLDAFANYSIRVRIRPNRKGYWSGYATTFCQTKPTIPEGALGTVPGAYEEVGNGGQRQVTLYWQGIPARLRNGPDFQYRLIIRDVSGRGESLDLGETNFANQFIVAPANSSFFVDVIPINREGQGIKETTLIPAVRDYPLMIERAIVVKFITPDAVTYEISWTANRKTDFFDVFWCPTSLLPHLAKCTYSMSHVVVAGNLKAYNLTLDTENEYRFAVAGRQGDSFSGMTWIARSCTSTDLHARLEGLTVTAKANASVDLAWEVPCQHRFLPISGYRVYYYPCNISAPKECSPDKFMDVLDGTSLTVANLYPGRRYCFLVVVLDDVTSTSPYIHKVEQCITTSQLMPPLPMSSIIGGSVAGAIFLVILAFMVWRFIKRLRNDFKEIQKQSRIINIPPGMFDQHEDGYNQDRTHYTKVDLDVTNKLHTRQLSNLSGISSSGHGSVTSEETIPSSRVSGSDDVDSSFMTRRVDLVSGLNGTRLADFSLTNGSGRVKHRHSTFDFDRLSQIVQKSRARTPDTVSLGSSDSSLPGLVDKAKPRSRTRATGMHITVPLAMLSSGGDTTDSGVSDAQTSCGYVAASGLTGAATALVSLGTPDLGYASQQSTLSDSLNGSENSVFSELDPQAGDLQRGKTGLSYPQSEGDHRMDYGGSEGNLSSFGETDAEQSSVTLTTQPCSVLPEKVAVGSGYVAWP